MVKLALSINDALFEEIVVIAPTGQLKVVRPPSDNDVKVTDETLVEGIQAAGESILLA